MDNKQEVTCTTCNRTFTVDTQITTGFCLLCGAPFTLQEVAASVNNCALEANKVKEIYNGYIHDMEELNKEKHRGIFEMLLGQDSFGSDPLHSRYRELIADAVQRLSEAAAVAKDENHCTEIARLLLLEKPVNSTTIYWPLIALEQLSESLIPFIPLDSLLEIYTEYNRINPSNQSLPNQVGIKKNMVSEIEKKGGTIPKYGFFSKKRK